MAESQVPFPYTPEDMTAIRSSISADRFATYLTAAKGNEHHALDLYLYNARLAKAFLYPLHVGEVTLRNAIDEVLTDLHGPTWPTNQGFNDQLTPESRKSLAKAIARASTIQRGPPRGQVVATLTFDFWSNLFRPDYDRPIWQVNLRKALPHCQPRTTRAEVQILVRDINFLRNRIAHHEPILSVNATSLHADIVRLVEMRSPSMSRWLRYHSTLSTVIRTKPRPGMAAQTAIERCDTGFQAVAEDHTLASVLATYSPDTPAIVCVDQAGSPTALLSAAEIVAYASGRLTGTMIDFGEHKVADLLSSGIVLGRWASVVTNAPIAELVDVIKGPGIRGVVVVEERNGMQFPRGVLLRAHRRY